MKIKNNCSTTETAALTPAGFVLEPGTILNSMSSSALINQKCNHGTAKACLWPLRVLCHPHKIGTAATITMILTRGVCLKAPHALGGP